MIENLEHIEEAIKLLNKVRFSVESKIPPKDLWRQKYDFLCTLLQQQESDARDLLDDMKNNNLTVSSIEAEGFVRGSFTAANLIAYVNEHFEYDDF